MNTKEEDELEVFLELVKRCYGYDFHEYARASLKRRIRHLANDNGYQYISEMLPKILYDSAFLNTFLHGMSVTVTETFRDPWVFKTLRDQVIPKLKIFPQINIWVAGCATGEEAYSIAIILQEEELLPYAKIYATDFNAYSLETAKKGIYPLKYLQKYTKNYQQAGGKHAFSDYYHVKYSAAKMDDSLKQNIVFSNHNLAIDKAFGKMNLVLCRNVLIYFQRILQDKVLRLFKESLSAKGFLLLGEKEGIEYSQVFDYFDVFAKKEKIFRMK